MAKIAEKYSNKVIVTSDNPRNENVEAICKDIELGFTKKDYTIIHNREDAINNALEKMDKNSVLLLLGKGRDDYEQIGNEKFPHSDISIIKSQIK